MRGRFRLSMTLPRSGRLRLAVRSPLTSGQPLLSLPISPLSWRLLADAPIFTFPIPLGVAVMSFGFAAEPKAVTAVAATRTQRAEAARRAKVFFMARNPLTLRGGARRM